MKDKFKTSNALACNIKNFTQTFKVESWPNCEGHKVKCNPESNKRMGDDSCLKGENYFNVYTTDTQEVIQWHSITLAMCWCKDCS